MNQETIHNTMDNLSSLLKYSTSNSEEKAKVVSVPADANSDISTRHYWIYSPGDRACKWEEFYNKEIMAIGWGKIGNLLGFATKDEIKQQLKECFDPLLSYKNTAHATWQFSREMKVGDVIIVKKGMHQIVGKGEVISDYYYDDSASDGYNNVRKVRWTNKGEWGHPGQAAMKTLTDITAYSDYVENLLRLFDEEMPEDIEELEIEYLEYTPEMFLNEVYMNKEAYNTLISLIKNKKNIILEGAPGVGKTFAAKRLAYSMMGVKDTSRVMMVQFQQSYSYEDFIMGYRPTKNGFELKKGAFYNFCKRAEIDSDNDYFFIIDEINRGNLSKIFGELFMLIENDKRGMKIQLIYSDEQFSVPKNVYLIGLMNTADRSLAMLDYALRRRFAFYEFVPAFNTEGFIKYKDSKNNLKFNNLISTVERLNKAIEDDETLGKGFMIGHSYFCTENEIDDSWLNSVVRYELVPLINEYWFDEPEKIRDWERALYGSVQ